MSGVGISGANGGTGWKRCGTSEEFVVGVEISEEFAGCVGVSEELVDAGAATGVGGIAAVCMQCGTCGE